MRRTGALLALGLLLGASAVLPVSAVQAQDRPEPVEVLVDTLLPRAPAPGDDLRLSGRLRSDVGVDDVVVRLEVGRALTSRGQLTRADEVPPPTPRLITTVEVGDLPRGSDLAFDLGAAVDELGLTAIGVYPVEVEVQGTPAGESDRRPVGRVRTALPWFDGQGVDPLRLAWVWPLVDEPRTGPDGVLLDDGLTASLAADGRLGRALAAGRAGESPTCAPGAAPCDPVPVTWAVDPELLDTAALLTGPHQVRDGSAVVDLPGSVDATRWTEGLREAVAVPGAGLLALPYADPDVVALTRAGSDLAGEVATARTYGAVTTRRVLAADPDSGVLLPPPGPVTEVALDALSTGEASAVVLDPVALEGAPEGPATPGARTALPSVTPGLSGLVLEPALSGLLEPDAPTSPRLAEQRWLVESAMISLERPSDGRTLVVVPPRRGDLDPAVAGEALRDTGRVPWLCAVPLEDVAASRERCAQTTTDPSYDEGDRGALTRVDPQTALLGPAALDRVEAAGDAVDQLTGSVLVGGTDAALATRTRLEEALLRTTSSAWRVDGRRGERLTTLLAGEVDALFGQVQLLTDSVLLTSRTGRIPIDLVNNLDQAVTVQVQLTAASGAQLSAQETTVYEIPARNAEQVQVEATTLTSGRFVVTAQLLDRDGRPFGTQQELEVRSTRYGTVALAVTGLAAAVLLVSSGVRLVRRGLRRS